MKSLLNIKILPILNLITQKGLKLILYIGISIVLYKVVKFIFHSIQKNKLGQKYLNQKKTQLLMSILLNILKYIIYFITILLILKDIFNINPTLIVTATGVLGLAIGLGIQGLLKDFISGLFILFENKFNIGDYIDINNIKGQVININIKDVTIMDDKGNINIIPNGMINKITRYEKRYETVCFNINYPSKNTKVDLIITKIKNQLLNQYNEIQAFSNIIYKKKIGQYNYSCLTVKINPFNDYIIDIIKNILQNSISDITINTNKINPVKLK